MVVRIARVLSASVMLLVLLANVQPAACEGWSILHPFSSGADAKPKSTAPKAATKKQPSAWEKAGTGTKTFFSKTGETLGLKKAAPQKPTYASPKPPVINTPKKDTSKSWLGSLFQPEEQQKPKDVGEWMASTKRMDP